MVWLNTYRAKVMSHDFFVCLFVLFCFCCLAVAVLCMNWLNINKIKLLIISASTSRVCGLHG